MSSAAPRTMLVVSAHSADFVWRAAGAIARFVEDGGTAHVVSLSYGERGESGELWKEPGQTEERVKKIRHGEAETAACGARRELPQPRSRRLSARDGRARGGAAAGADARARAERDPRPRVARPVQPGPRRRARGDDAGAAARERRRRRERLQDDHAARMAQLRAAPARAVRLRPDDVPRHHAGLGQEGEGDGGDGRAGLSPSVLLRARGAPRQPRAARLGPQATSSTPRRSSASYRIVVDAL